MSGETEAYWTGFRLGQTWAAEAGTGELLESLRIMRNDVRDFEWDAMFDDEMPNYSYGEWLASCIIEGNDPDKLRAFWKWAIGADDLDKLEDPQFVKGFAEGAMAE